MNIFNAAVAKTPDMRPDRFFLFTQNLPESSKT